MNHKKQKKSSHKPIIFKTPAQIDAIRQAGQMLTELLQHIGALTKPGVSLLELESHAVAFLKQRNVKGSFK
jgi:methionine aminopeptidase